MNLSTTLTMTSAGRWLKVHDRVETVAEFRREHPVDRLDVLAFALRAGEADRRRAAISDAPALVVMIKMTLRKSMLLPL